ncbi:hypothetical protein [Hyphococcus sp.]|uniref:hypothetical protein n=1 Tax=Hyphococcus sp. TaxID=2038636 RepID=UPI0020823EB0|nr:MAG: hypothetical protein DHS20C04_29490 [Marinicaulis sp.]
MKAIHAAIILALLLGACATSEMVRAKKLLSNHCSEIEDWALAPYPADSSQRSVSFHWPDCEDCIVMGASMSSERDLDEIDRALYEAIRSPTHYYGLGEISYGAASCFTNRIKLEKDEFDEVVSVDADTRLGKRNLNFHFRQTECYSGEEGDSGCATFTVADWK